MYHVSRFGIWPKGHLRLLSLDLKFKKQGRDVSECDIPAIEISRR
jgi:hypothetical protein